MEFVVLGPIEARVDGAAVPLGGPKQRALVAVLLLARGEFVSRDRLIDALWGERPPATAPHTLDAYVSRVRKLVGPDRLSRSPGGYALHVAPGELDVDRFDALAAQGRSQLAAGSPAEAAATLRSALALWRGAALADVLNEPFAAREGEILEERRLTIVEDRIDADLASTEPSELVGELERLVREHPFRERLLAQLMLALYRSGQHARALDAYRAARQRLAEELGLEPGRTVQALERAILTHDPALGAPVAARGRPPAPRRRRRLAAAGIVVAIAAGAGVSLVLALRGTPRTRVPAATDGVVELRSGSAAPGAGVALETAPAAIAAGFGSLWVAEPSRSDIARVDLRRRSVVDRIPVGGAPTAVAVGGGSVWVAGVPGDRVSRIDPGAGTVTQTIGLGGGTVSALAFGGGRLWVADALDESLLEVDPASGLVRRTVTLPFTPTALAVTGRVIWVVDYDDGTVNEVDPRGGSILATTRVGTGPSAIAIAGGSVWVANELDGTVSRIDADTGSVAATVPVESGPAAIVAAGGSLWVANRDAASVSRIDAAHDVVIRTTAVGGSPTALAVSSGSVWAGTRSVAQHRGGTVTVLHTRPITIDPALQQDLLPLASDGLTRDELVIYAHEPGSAGTRLVPDLAENVPLPTNGGTTYAFRLRRGIRYSDGRLVRAADYRRGIERAFRVHAIARDEFTDIVGAAACSEARCDLSRGIVADEAASTVTFHLRAPNPDFLSSLTSPPQPARGTPWHPVTSTPIPGTGPYVIAEASSSRIVWARNARFHEWSRAAQPAGNPDRIVLRFGLEPAREVREIEAGRADVLVDNIPAPMLPAVQTRYATQLHSFVIPTTDFFQFNTTIAPFDDVRVRRALNLAIDRRAIVRLYGGSALATPTCQVLPPGVAGYRRYCPYTAGSGDGAWHAPDLARARRLVSVSGTRGKRVTVWGWTDDPTISEAVVRYVGRVLRSLGYRVRVRLVTHASLQHPPARVDRSIQLIAVGWGDTPYGFVATWFACGGVNTHGWFCDPLIDRLNARARALQATNAHAAAAIWRRIDRNLVDQAASLPMVNERGIDFLSAHVANYESQPYLGLIVDQLRVVRR